MQPTDDSELLRQYAENHSDEAFAALVQRHINLVYSVALRHIGDPHHAEEITQAVFIILAKKALQLRHDKALSSWLFQATRLTANNFVRSEARRHRREQEAYMQSTTNESGDNIWQRIVPLLDTAVAGLNEKDRRAIVLRFYEGRNLREVGAALGASEDTAKKRVARALEKLQKYFSKHGVSSTTTIIAATISANSVQAAPVALAKSVTAVAIAKGVAASASTLTLIKGALKIMAWTKMKTAIVVGAAIILAAGTTTVVVKKTSTPSIANIDEAWWRPDNATLEKVPPMVAVRQSKPGTRQAVAMGNPNKTNKTIKMIGTSLSPEDLFVFAYRVVDVRTVLPDNLANERFDLIMTATDRQPEQLQKEIQKKLGYVGTLKTIETDVLLLQLKTGETLKLKTTTGGRQENPSPTTARIVMKNQPIEQLARTLENHFHKPVLDKTGVTGHYDIPIPNMARKNSPGGYVSDATARQECQQIMDELGLELLPSREPTEMLVVEKMK